jgi:N-acetylmuramoyl-L-alanine amidase
MKKYFHLSLFALALLFASALTSCKHDTLEDRAEKEAKEFTKRYCPTPVQNMQRTDSISFDRSTLTFNYYYRLSGDADDRQAVNKVQDKIKDALLNDLVSNTGIKAYKDKGYNFRYVIHSEKTKEVLYEVIFTPKDYQ